MNLFVKHLPCSERQAKALSMASGFGSGIGNSGFPRSCAMILQTKVPITPTRRRLHTIYKAEYPLQWKRRYATVAPPRIPPDLIGSSQSKSSSTSLLILMPVGLVFVGSAWPLPFIVAVPFSFVILSLFVFSLSLSSLSLSLLSLSLCRAAFSVFPH